MNLSRIIEVLEQDGVPKTFISTVVNLAIDFDQIRDVLTLYTEQTEQEHKDLILQEIHELIYLCNRKF